MRVMGAMRRSGDTPTNIITQFITTFGVWLLADRLGLSGVLTIVSYAITAARQAPASTPARLRVPSYAVWETTVFVLNVLAFVLIGLQIGPIVENLPPEQRFAYLGIGIAGARNSHRHAHRLGDELQCSRAMACASVRFPSASTDDAADLQGRHSHLLVRHAGYRHARDRAGIAERNDGAAFPYRDLIVFTAFCVVFGTLVVQGLTLRPLLARLDLRDDDPVGREVDRARTVAYGAAIAALDGHASALAEAIRVELQSHLQSNDGSSPQDDSTSSSALRLRAVRGCPTCPVVHAFERRNRRRRFPSAGRGD